MNTQLLTTSTALPVTTPTFLYEKNCFKNSTTLVSKSEPLLMTPETSQEIQNSYDTFVQEFEDFIRLRSDLIRSMRTKSIILGTMDSPKKMSKQISRLQKAAHEVIQAYINMDCGHLNDTEQLILKGRILHYLSCSYTRYYAAYCYNYLEMNANTHTYMQKH